MLGTVVGVAALLAAACGSSGSNASNTGNTGNTGSKTNSGTSKPTKTTGSSGSNSSSLTGLFGTLPSTSGTPTNGGTITVGEITGSTPQFIFPVTPANLASVYTDYVFQNIMWEPIYWSPQGQVPEYDQSLSIANPPAFSDGNKTVTVNLKSTYKWSNGAPVDAQDVIFFLDLVKAAVKENASNWNNYTPGFLPDNLASATAPSKYTLVLKLKKAYNPGYFEDDQLDLLYALPSTDWNIESAGGAHVTDYNNPAVAKKIYDYLYSQGKDIGSFGTNKLWKDVDGPYVIQSFNATNGDYVQKANMSYGGPKPHITNIDANAYTTTQALFNQLKAGTLDFAGFNGEIDPSEIPQFNQLHGYSTFGLPDFGFQAAFLNFANPTNSFNKIIGQLYIRQVLAYMQDQPGYVKSKGLLAGAGGTDYGPIPAIPASPYAPKSATIAPYPYNPSKAESLLKSHGWSVVSGGVDSCQSPGSGPSNCGAGIPKGAKLSFLWQYANTPPLTQALSEAYASALSQIGIHLTLQSKTFNYLIANDSDPSAKSNIPKWDVVDFGGFTQSLYPTTLNLFNIGGTFNLGFYNDKHANQLINASVFGGNKAAVTAEANYLTTDLPVLYQPNPDVLTAIKDTIGGTEASFLSTTQDTFVPQYWYIKK